MPEEKGAPRLCSPQAPMRWEAAFFFTVLQRLMLNFASRITHATPMMFESPAVYCKGFGAFPCTSLTKHLCCSLMTREQVDFKNSFYLISVKYLPRYLLPGYFCADMECRNLPRCAIYNIGTRNDLYVIHGSGAVHRRGFDGIASILGLSRRRIVLHLASIYNPHSTPTVRSCAVSRRRRLIERISFQGKYTNDVTTVLRPPKCSMSSRELKQYRKNHVWRD